MAALAALKRARRDEEREREQQEEAAAVDEVDEMVVLTERDGDGEATTPMDADETRFVNGDVPVS